MVSILKEIDITQMFNHFAQKKCINHQRRKASSVCLHQDCWELELEQAFFCEECNVNHIKRHGDSLRFDALFTDELFEELDEFSNNQNTKDKSKEKISKFDKKIDELHSGIEQWTTCQFTELKKFFEHHSIDNLQVDHFEAINNLKKMLSEARIELSLNYEFKERVKTYCIKILKIQNDLNELIYLNGQVINEAEKKDQESNLKLQKMANEIQENVKKQVNQITEYLIDSNKKSKSLKNESLIKEEVSKPIFM